MIETLNYDSTLLEINYSQKLHCLLGYSITFQYIVDISKVENKDILYIFWFLWLGRKEGNVIILVTR